MDNIEQRIEATKAKLKQLSAQKRLVEARQRSEASKRARTDDTRRKILIGAAILAKVDRGEWPRERLLAMMEKALTRESDRTLFGLSQVTEESSLIANCATTPVESEKQHDK